MSNFRYRQAVNIAISDIVLQETHQEMR